MAEAKTQAVQAVVGTLLAAATVTPGVGIFEVQEHHSGVAWFTSCAVCIIAAILIPIAVFIMFPWIEHLGAQHTERRHDVASSTEKGHKPLGAAVESERIFIDTSPKSLTDTYASYKTDLEADTAVDRYRGKWMKVEGKLDNMYFLGTAKEDLIVSIRSEGEGATGEAPEVGAQSKPVDQPMAAVAQKLGRTKVRLWFNNPKSIERLAVLSHGDSVKALGRVTEIGAYSVKLQDCEIIG